MIMPNNIFKSFVRKYHKPFNSVVLFAACLSIAYHLSYAYMPNVYAAIQVIIDSFAFPTFEGTTGSDFVLNLFKI